MAQRFSSGGQVHTGGVRVRSDGVAGVVGDVTVVRAGTATAAETGLETAVERGASGRDLPTGLTRSGLPEAAAAPLGGALADSGMYVSAVVPLDQLTAHAEPAGTTRGGRSAGPALDVSVDAPGSDEHQVLLEVDATGVVRWHFHANGGAAAPGVLERAGGTHTFRVPVSRVAVSPSPDEDATDGGLLAFGVRKVLHILRFPVEAAGREIGGRLVTRWERRHRPYGLAPVTPRTLQSPVDGRTPDREEWRRLAEGPVLLFVHGTFSRARSTFGGLAGDPALLPRLHERYGGRLLVFDHPTLHVDPLANARWLAEQVPAGARLTLDVVAHSRGGLVARSLPRAAMEGAAPVEVRTLVHVATPNAGTVLASEERLGSLLDVFTNLLMLFPDGAVAVPLEAVVEVVKQLATGVRSGLDGLTAMDPDGKFLEDLDAPVERGTSCRAMTTDFRGSTGSLPVRALDALVDAVFDAANDLVVPTEGVYHAGRYRVRKPLVLPPASEVTHNTFFSDSTVRSELLECLSG